MTLKPHHLHISTVLIAGSILLSGCQNQQDLPPVKSDKKEVVTKGPPPATVKDGEQIGTPMAERVAVVGLLNKRNGQTRDFELKPGESVRIGKVVIRLRACERTAPWETYPDIGAFVQLIVRERPRGTNNPERWAQVFSGWLFKENPAANVVEHPIYDVWVKDCKMSFPGEEAPRKSDPDAPEDDKKPSNAPQSPAKPAPEPEPEPDEEAVEGEGEATVET